MARKPDPTARALLDVTMLLMRSVAAGMRKGEKRLAPAHVGLLARLVDGPCSISELAQHQAVRLPTISRSVSLLVERGLVERWTPPQNRRQAMVALTVEGRRALDAMKREAERHTATVLNGLTDTERHQVRAALDILSRELERARAAQTGRAT